MPAVICCLHITLLDFKFNIAGGLKPAMEIQNQQSPQPDGDNPRYPLQTRASFVSDHGQYLEENDCPSLSCCWNSLKKCGATLCALT